MKNIQDIGIDGVGNLLVTMTNKDYIKLVHHTYKFLATITPKHTSGTWGANSGLRTVSIYSNPNTVVTIEFNTETATLSTLYKRHTLSREEFNDLCSQSNISPKPIKMQGCQSCKKSDTWKPTKPID
jgi:hypothetical protein